MVDIVVHERLVTEQSQFGFRKTRYQGLAKNASQVNLLGRPGQFVPAQEAIGGCLGRNPSKGAENQRNFEAARQMASGI